MVPEWGAAAFDLADYLTETFAELLGEPTDADNAIEHAILMLEQLELMMPG